MVQNIGNSLPAETLLTEMLGQNGSRHFLQVSHTVDRNTIADYLLKIRGRDILCFPDLIPSLLLLILLVHGCNNFLCALQKPLKFLESLTLLVHRIVPSGFQAC